MALQAMHGRRQKEKSVHKSKPYHVRLAELRSRAGLTTRKVADHLGYGSVGGYHKYERAAHGDRAIPYSVVKGLIPLFVGAGAPQITLDEVLALTDVQEGVPKRVAQAFVSSVVDDGHGVLGVRYSVQEGAYVKPSPQQLYGASMLGVSRLFPASKQFVVAVGNDGDVYPRGSQLLCVEVSEFANGSLAGRRVVLGVPYGDSDLVAITVADTAPSGKFFDLSDTPVSGDVLGVVLGAYLPEVDKTKKR